VFNEVENVGPLHEELSAALGPMPLRYELIFVDDGSTDGTAAELSAILGFMEQLSGVDISGVEPMTSVTPMKLPLRTDEVTAGSQRDAVLANAPDTRAGFFAVPKVVE